MDVQQYKVIYKDVVHNPISICPTFGEAEEGGVNKKIKFIEMIYVNEDGELKCVEDEAWCFRFVRR